MLRSSCSPIVGFRKTKRFAAIARCDAAHHRAPPAAAGGGAVRRRARMGGGRRLRQAARRGRAARMQCASLSHAGPRRLPATRHPRAA